MKIEDITSRDNNRVLLRMLQDNNWIANCVSMRLCDETYYPEDDAYVVSNEKELVSIGHYLGNNTSLRELRFDFKLGDPGLFEKVIEKEIDVFTKGFNNNKHIQKVVFHGLEPKHGDLFTKMIPFFENNNNLTCIEVSSCMLLTEGCRLLSNAIEGCKSLACFEMYIDTDMYRIRIDDGQITHVFRALSKLKQLKKVDIRGCIIEQAYGDESLYRMSHPPSFVNECNELLSLLRNASLQILTLGQNEFGDNEVDIFAKGIGQLHELSLGGNNIGDRGMEVLTNALLSNTRLRYLNLSFSHDRKTTAKGWKSLSTLLERPDSNLEVLVLQYNRIDDEVALNFAKALTNNCSLKRLNIKACYVKSKGWEAFQKLLCDSTSIDSTFLSNHTLESLDDWVGWRSSYTSKLPATLTSCLEANREADKVRVAKMKVLNAHPTLDMTSLFEWDLKALPYVTTWFDETPSLPPLRKLQVIYQFIRTLPGELEGVCNRGVVGSKRKAVS